MNISALRSRFKTVTGREDFSNSSVDSFINNGIRMLDQLSGFQFSPAKNYQEITLGVRTVNLTSDCTALTKVWLIEANTGRTILTPMDSVEYHKKYGDYNGAPGKPVNYANRVTRPANVSYDPLAFAAYAKYLDVIKVSDSTQSFRGILLGPAADKNYLLELEGKFFSHELTDGDGVSISPLTENWWSKNYPLTVLDAALYTLYYNEYRNNEGAAPYAAAIKTVLTHIDYDNVLEEMEGVDRMEG